MKGLVAVLLGIVLGSCGSSNGGGSGNAQALCMQGSQAICDKVYDCPEGASLREGFGATKADCLTGLNAECTATGCDPGETYHPDMAQACLSAIQAVQCPALSDPAAIFPAPCLQVCTGGTQ